MYNGNDQFGKMMVKNFKERGAPLDGLSFFTSFDHIKEEYKKAGFNEFEIKDMLSFSRESLNPAEVQRYNLHSYFT